MGFTRNYYLLKMFSSGAPFWDNEKSVSNEWRLRNTEGKYQTSQITTKYGGYAPLASPLGTTGSTHQSDMVIQEGACYITVGVSDTPESFDNYTMTHPANIIKYTDVGVKYQLNEDCTMFNVTMYRTFLNPTTEPIVIKEVGILQDVNGSKYLIYREVLDTPVTIPANGYYKASVSYTVPVPSEIISTEEPSGTYSERIYNHFKVDQEQYPYMLIRVLDTLAYLFIFKEREDIHGGGNYSFKNGVYDLQLTIERGSTISEIVSVFETKAVNALSFTTISMDANEYDNYTYYANFNHTEHPELGYNGLGTWKTLE